MIFLHRLLESNSVPRADLGLDEVFEFLPEVHRVRAYLPGASLGRVCRVGSGVFGVAPFGPLPRGLKAGENAHYFQHDSAAMQWALEWPECVGDTGINIILEFLFFEYLVGRLLSPGNELVEKIVGWNASVEDFVFCGDEIHGCGWFIGYWLVRSGKGSRGRRRTRIRSALAGEGELILHWRY